MRKATIAAASVRLLAALSAGLSAVTLAGACGPGGAGAPEGTSFTPSGPSATAAGSPGAAARPGTPRVVVRGLEVPWGVAFLPDGDALVTERDSARLLRVTPGGEVDVVGRFSGVDPAGEGGLLGLAPAPTFSRDRWVYAYYSTARDNRIVRFRYREDGSMGPLEVIVDGIPHGAIHNGGRLGFGPDGMLYATTGESGNADLAQDRDSLGGKILRMTPDGEPAPGNPFGTLVYSYGHRNVEGIAFAGDRAYATEFGANRFDELNRIRPGENYGWPQVEGHAQGSDFTNPLLTWSTDEASPAGAAIAGGSIWAAALAGERVWQVPLHPDGSVGRPEAWFVGDYGRLRTVTVTPRGELWVTTSNRDGRGDPAAADDRILAIPLR